MSDLIIFGVGCLVSLIVACAVLLLLWGSFHEQRDVHSVPQKPVKNEVRGARASDLVEPSPVPVRN